MHDIPSIYQLSSTRAQQRLTRTETLQRVTLSPISLASQIDVREKERSTFLDLCADCYSSNKSLPFHNLGNLDKYIDQVRLFFKENFSKK